MIATLQDEVVQGPLDHERLGRVVVVRPTVETPRAGRFPTQAVVVTTAARTLMALSKEGEKVQAVLVVGNEGRDPTSHPEFHEISQNLRELCNKWFPKAHLCLVSDVPELERPESRHALSFYDQPIVRLEAGTQKTYTALTGSPGAEFKAIVENLGKLEIERLIVQASFVRGQVDNSKDSEVKAWLRHLTDIRPAGIHISTPAKAGEGKGKPVTKTRMGQIADLIAEKTGITPEVCQT